MYDDELVENQEGGRRRTLYMKSFGERTDLNVFKWRTKRQLIRIPVDRNTCVGSKKFSL